MKNKYNGWKNRATWLIHLYMNNDEGTYSWMNEMISNHLKEYGDISSAPSDELLWEITEVLKDDMTEMFIPSDFHSDGHDDEGQISSRIKEDLLNIALNEVDWIGLTRSLLADWIETNETQPTK